MPFGDRKRLVPPVFEFLCSLPVQFEGDASTQSSPFARNIDSLGIVRGQPSGPYFSTACSGPINDASISAIRAKYSKQYVTKSPIHLLAYSDWAPMPPVNEWLPQFRAFVESTFSQSQFAKLWVFDNRKRLVVYQYPS